MGLFFGKKEKRAEAVGFEDTLLRALLGGGTVTREMALQVPTVSGGIDLIANIVAGTPVKLYREGEGKAEEVRGDPRVRLLNDETGDTLNAGEFWRAMIRDYYLGKGGYAYIQRERGAVTGLYYVEEERVSIQKNTDPIFKDFDILVDGRSYRPFEFLRILRNTRDGASGVPITEESARLIETAYAALVFERNSARRGGNRRGFLKSPRRLDKESLDTLRSAFSRLYGSEGEGNENFVVLNEGIEFQEASSTSAEMQLNENKAANAEEFAKIFHISTAAMSGKADESDVASLARLCAIPLMEAIQCALNRDLLLESEKGRFYWAFDTKELLRGDMQTRFAAYKTALEANFMQIDEVRYAEDMEPLGLTWVKLGLNDVLYDPRTRQVYTPNTNQTASLRVTAGDNDGAARVTALDNDDADAQPRGGLGNGPTGGFPGGEERGNPNHDPETGQFTSGPGGLHPQEMTPRQSATRQVEEPSDMRKVIETGSPQEAQTAGGSAEGGPHSQETSAPEVMNTSGNDTISGGIYEKPKGFSQNKNGEKTLDNAERQRYNEILIGSQTSDGTQITGMSSHAYDRAAQRALSPGQILDSLKSHPTPSKSDETCVTYDGQGHRTVVNKETGKIVTIMHRRQAK